MSETLYFVEGMDFVNTEGNEVWIPIVSFMDRDRAEALVDYLSKGYIIEKLEGKNISEFRVVERSV